MTLKLLPVKGDGNVHRISFKKARRRHGFSIIELLIAIIIIGILVTVLIPVVSNRAEQARQAKVQSDLEIITEALNRVSIDTGYYVRLFALNDQLVGDGIAFDRTVATIDDDLREGLTDYTIANPFYQFQGTNGLFISPDTGDYALTTRDRVIERLRQSESRYSGSISWNGPYVNYIDDDNFYDGVLLPDGIPDDPWGNNYLLFTELGVVLEPSGEIVTSVGFNSDGDLVSPGAFTTEVFDRPHVLSMGPNGLPGDGGADDPEYGTEDDLYRPFGY